MQKEILARYFHLWELKSYGLGLPFSEEKIKFDLPIH